MDKQCLTAAELKAERGFPLLAHSFLVQTLLKRADFLSVSKVGKKSSTKCFVLLAAPNSVGIPRVGYTVSKKVSKLAVERNKVKRRLKAAVRKLADKFPTSTDFVIIARYDALRRPFKDLEGDIIYALKKLG